MPEFLILRNPETMHGAPFFFKYSGNVFLGNCQEHFKINFIHIHLQLLHLVHSLSSFRHYMLF